MNELRRIDRDDPEFLSIRAHICNGGIIQDIVSPFWFDKQGPLQSIIHALKYQHIPQAGEHLGMELGRELQRTGIDAGAVVPVPLHKAREREREYNQAEYIARGVSGVTGAKVVVNALRRLHNTSTQTELTAVQRRTNVAGAFGPGKAPAQDIPGGPVLLVDDVLTTGATIVEAAALLRRGGSGPVVAGTIALAARSHG